MRKKRNNSNFDEKMRNCEKLDFFQIFCGVKKIFWSEKKKEKNGKNSIKTEK